MYLKGFFLQNVATLTIRLII